VNVKRNDPLLNQYHPGLASVWRANHDIQVLVDTDQIARYLCKYVVKGEKCHAAYLKFLTSAVTRFAAAGDGGQYRAAVAALQSAFVRMLGQRDISAVEAACILMGIPLYEVSDTVHRASVHTDVRISDGDVQANWMLAYADRDAPLHDIPFYDFVRQFQIGADNRLQQRGVPRARLASHIPSITPCFFSMRAVHVSYPSRCWVQCVKFMPWTDSPSTLWAPHVTDAAVLAVLNSVPARQYVPDTTTDATLQAAQAAACHLWELFLDQHLRVEAGLLTVASDRDWPRGVVPHLEWSLKHHAEAHRRKLQARQPHAVPGGVDLHQPDELLPGGADQLDASDDDEADDDGPNMLGGFGGMLSDASDTGVGTPPSVPLGQPQAAAAPRPRHVTTALDLMFALPRHHADRGQFDVIDDPDGANGDDDAEHNDTDGDLHGAEAAATAQLLRDRAARMYDSSCVNFDALQAAVTTPVVQQLPPPALDDPVPDFDAGSPEQQFCILLLRAHALQLRASRSHGADAPGPLHMVLAGTAGTGKSWLIHRIRAMLGNWVLVCAPTGRAAYSVAGRTMHSLFHLPVPDRADTPLAPLDATAARRLIAELSPVQYFVLDEYSMCGSLQLSRIHERLVQLFGSAAGAFAGRSIILVGDIAQFNPIGQSAVYLVSILFSRFKHCIRLSVIQRQLASERAFIDLLDATRNCVLNPEHIRLLRSRQPSRGATVPPNLIPDLVHVYGTNAEVRDRNDAMLQQLATDTHQPIVVSLANHSLPGSFSSDAYEQETGLPRIIRMAIGAPVMLLRNLNVTAGLLNGTMATIVDIVYLGATLLPQPPTFVLLHVPSYSGPTLLPEEFWNQGPGLPPPPASRDKLVPIFPADSTFLHAGKTIHRFQLPFRLAFASTLHKLQGQTIAAGHLHLSNRAISHNAPAVFVGLSRARTLDTLLIDPFNPATLRQGRTKPAFYLRIRAELDLVTRAQHTLREFNHMLQPAAADAIAHALDTEHVRLTSILTTLTAQLPALPAAADRVAQLANAAAL
jgi:hypothetical protein